MAQKGGRITIDEDGTWTYHAWEGNSVSDPGGLDWPWPMQEVAEVEEKETVGRWQAATPLAARRPRRKNWKEYREGQKEAKQRAEGTGDLGISKITKDSPGQIIFGELDNLGRPTGVTATITKDMIGTGSKASQSIKPPGFLGGGPGSPGHARGHLLGNQLGGTGKDDRNLVTLYQNPVNSPVMRDFESFVRAAVEKGEVVRY